MSEATGQWRRNPDLFTGEEAAEYLHLSDGWERTLEMLRQTHGLAAAKIGPNLMYHRDDLDSCIARVFRKCQPVAESGPRLKIGGR